MFKKMYLLHFLYVISDFKSRSALMKDAKVLPAAEIVLNGFTMHGDIFSSTGRQCCSVCECVGGETGESVNQSSALTERLRQQLTSESAAATATTGPRSPSREDSRVQKPSSGGEGG